MKNQCGKGRLALLRALTLAVTLVVAPSAFASNFVGDLVYCDVAGEAGVYDPALGDFGLDGVEVTVQCHSRDTGEMCGTWTTTTGQIDNISANGQSTFFGNSTSDSPQGCSNAIDYTAADLSGRYLINILSTPPGSTGAGCFGAANPQCTITVNQATVPPTCANLVTPIVDVVTVAGDVPSDGNTDGDFCDPEDGPFAEGQLLGNSGLTQNTCQQYPSPGPSSSGVHVSVSTGGGPTYCALYNDFGFTGGSACELEVEAFCSIINSDGLACDEKLAAMELIYTGPDVLGATVEIAGKDSGFTQFVGDLVAGTMISVDGRPNDLGSKTTISINGVEEVIHTSCSVDVIAGAPAPLDDPKGDPSSNWLVDSFIDKQGTVVDPTVEAPLPECTIVKASSDSKKKKAKKKAKKKSVALLDSNQIEYSYVISNVGSASAFDVVAIDDQIGELSGSPIAELLAGESVTLTESVEVLETVTNTVFVSAAGADGAVCEAEAMSTVTVEIPPASCADGDPKTLVFEYTGGSCADSMNTQTKGSCNGDPGGANGVAIAITGDADKVSATPSTGISVGDLVTITTTESKLGSSTKLDIVGGAETQSLDIHTSCSDDLIAGQSFGALTLVEFIPES